jgi:uncharacterized protein (DUF2345 family)
MAGTVLTAVLVSGWALVPPTAAETRPPGFAAETATASGYGARPALKTKHRHVARRDDTVTKETTDTETTTIVPAAPAGIVPAAPATTTTRSVTETTTTR